ncbi:tegument protein US22 [Aotine betaherpesvirus 1]|uniref:Tegument protein US22 n=1 Tax=Aotine betaherpesvirus 1 TaxID=50290 RepID=G8XUK7_9BETA|nr:tegument protein US22 [Aotine betaherpesvirus 1]AEV80849.1 tegument protein US22 [Aotine betaherpesvirus 1]
MAVLPKTTAMAWSQYLKTHDDRAEDVVRCEFGPMYTRKSIFHQTMLMLHGIFVRVHDHAALREYVQKNTGTAICLRNPGTWFLVLRDGTEIPSVRGRRFDLDYLCCNEALQTVGILAVRSMGSEEKMLMETSSVLMLGATGAVYVYDWVTDALFEVAQNLEDFAEGGLIWYDSIYKHPATPYSTVEPRYHVDRFLAADPKDANAMAAVAHELRGLNLAVVTPGENEREPLLLLGELSLLRKMKPFIAMSDEDFAEMCDVITKTLCCLWRLIGVAGYYLKVGAFVPAAVIICDRFGAIYALKGEDGYICRLADDIQMFFRMGYLKLKGSYRYDRGCRGEARLECKPQCSHRYNRSGMEALAEYPMTEGEMEWYFDWLTRPTLKDEITFESPLGRTDLVPTGILTENQNWAFPCGSISTTPVSQDGAWQEKDLIATPFEDKRCFRAPRVFTTQCDDPDYEIEHDGDSRASEKSDLEKVPLSSSPPSPSPSKSSSLSTNNDKPRHPEVEKFESRNWEEEITTEKDAWTARVQRAQLMWKHECPTLRYRFPNEFQFPFGSSFM